MITRMCVVILLLVCAIVPADAADKGPWHGKRCAVCLTYDDALNVHLDKVVPLLDSLGLKATFYVTGSFPGFKAREADWQSVAAKGNELGNHTLFHPCEGRASGREWVRPEYDLNAYTVRRMIDEIDMEQFLLHSIDGRSHRTFAYPCGDTLAGGVSYVDSIRGRFSGARGVESKMQRRKDVDPYAIGAFVVNGQSGDELIALVKKAVGDSALLVFLFHGVGGEHSLNVSLPAHSELLHFLKQHEADIWIAPLVDIVEYMSRN